MRAWRAAVAALLIAGTVVNGPNPTSADSPYQTAYWSRFQIDIPGLGGVLPISVPPVPNGGLFISGGVVGILGFGAIRYYIEGPVPGTLSLHVDTGTALGATILACRVTSDWANGDNQAFVDAPTYDCNGAVAGTADTTGMNVTWELTEAYYRAEVFGIDIALVPGGATPVQVLFSAPGPDSFVHPPAVVPTIPTDEEPAAGLPPIDLLPGLVDLPFLAPIDIPGAPVPTAPPVQGAPTVPLTPSRVLPVADEHDDTGERLAAIAGLLVLIASFWWLAGGRFRATRSGEHGIGRFARPRAGAPPRL